MASRQEVETRDPGWVQNNTKIATLRDGRSVSIRPILPRTSHIWRPVSSGFRPSPATSGSIARYLD
jgi:hypothetical protein